MALSAPRRRPIPPIQESSSSSSDLYSKEDKAGKKGLEQNEDKGFHFLLPFVALALLRYMSASSNIVHDCDEVFNYWEPLHYVLYKSGFQTWEYSSEFSLRSYLYILFHTLVAGPASWFFHDEKVKVFYSVRLFLGLLSTITETVLVVALSRKFGKRLASYALALLCLTSGCYFASTSLLPSSFSMYAVTLSSALFLLGRHALAISVASVGVIIGWPFSILVVLPLTFYSLAKGKFIKVFLSGIATSTLILSLSLLFDYYYYGRWTSSVFNLLLYNVWGGGDSHLYGTEGTLFYLRNGFNNFNFCFVLALLFLVILPFTEKKFSSDLIVVISPVYIWLIFMSLQPHKEERFLYPIYPLICVAAAAVLESFPERFRDKYATEDTILIIVAKILRSIVFGLILCASHSRTFSIINGYSAPIEVYKHLQHHEDAGVASTVCVGSEWHRFPSSFFVPSFVKEVRWVDDGFRGLLPFPFNSTLGGTTAAPAYFNNKNKASDAQYLRDTESCTFFIELDLKRPYPARSSDLSTWEIILFYIDLIFFSPRSYISMKLKTLAALPFLDRELSPSVYRSFFIPYLWNSKNVFGLYKLLGRIRETDSGLE